MQVYRLRNESQDPERMAGFNWLLIMTCVSITNGSPGWSFLTRTAEEGRWPVRYYQDEVDQPVDLSRTVMGSAATPEYSSIQTAFFNTSITMHY